VTPNRPPSPDPNDYRKTSPEELFVDGEMDALKKFRKFAKTSKVKPRTINLTRKLN
jgi:hypothetical protein